MTFQRWLHVWFAIMAVALLPTMNGATAPDSIAGSVFRSKGGYAGTRILWEHTIILGGDGRYSVIKNAVATTTSGNWRIEAPPADGTYSYTKTGPTTGEVAFSDATMGRMYTVGFADGPSDGLVTLALNFNPTANVSSEFSVSGDLARGEYSRSPGGRIGEFSLTKLSTIQRQPVPNISVRGNMSADRPLIAGYVIQGDYKDVLIRVVGPSLRSLGVNAPWANPRFDIYRGGSPTPIGGPPGPKRDAISYYDDWSSDPSAVDGEQKLFAYVGAFPLEMGSQDAVGVTPRYPPGAYTVVCTMATGETGGEALIEVYFLP